MAELTKCPTCGRLYATQPGKDRCLECLVRRDETQTEIEAALQNLEHPTLAGIVDRTGLPEEVARRAIEDSPSLRAQIDLGKTCERCQKQPAQIGSDFCFTCRVELYRTFGDAVDMLLPHLERYEVEDAATDAALGLRSYLDEKRNRTGSGRINLGPDSRVK